MCGRSRSTLNRQQVAAAARIPESRWTETASYEPSYNLSPGHDAPVVKRGQDGQLEAQTMRWGLVPSWTKKGTKPDHFRMFNARSETVAEKSVFSRLLTSSRGVVYFNGFYEWLKDGSKKQPYYIHMGEDSVLRMAGLYDCWAADDGQLLHTFTILTTNSCKRLQWLHDRMPVLLTTPEDEAAWLGDKVDFKTFNRLAEPYNGEDLVWHQVTPGMGTPKMQGPECCKPLKKGPGIAAFFGKPKAAKPPQEGKASADSTSAQKTGASAGAAALSAEASPAAVKAEPRDASAAEAAGVQLDADSKSGAAVKAEPGAEQPAASQQPAADAAAQPPDPAQAPALPINPDEDVRAVKAQAEEQPRAAKPGPQQHSGNHTAASPPRSKRLAPDTAGPLKGKTPAAKRAKKDVASPTPKGQKTMQAFFAAKSSSK